MLDHVPMHLDNTKKLYEYKQDLNPNFIPIFPDCKVITSKDGSTLELWCVKKDKKSLIIDGVEYAPVSKQIHLIVGKI